MHAYKNQTSSGCAGKSDAADWFTRELQEYRKDPEFVAESLSLAINEKISALMEQNGITRADLAHRLGVKRAFVTRLLNGSANSTLLTLVRVATALDVELKIEFAPWTIVNTARSSRTKAAAGGFTIDTQDGQRAPRARRKSPVSKSTVEDKPAARV
ncbi:MAG TPA: helix-turn-helix transcriptional regulator [Armatimonadota bacterium]|nr:helix-turn-helix transcriptional regulator [Armatimonadota bacterium]